MGLGSQAILEARNLHIFWDEQEVVRDVSLTLCEHEISCIVGRSGTGKSTLFHALAGLSRPRSGQVLFEGADITGAPGHVSYMLQKDLLLPNLSVLDNAALPLVVRGVPRDEARVEAESYLEQFELSGVRDAWPRQLSGGMRQRAALLRTYLMQNKVVLLDEPFSALDAFTRQEIRSWFCAMVEDLGLSALIITHDVDEAVLVADRVHVLSGSPSTGRPSTITTTIEVFREGVRGSEDFGLTEDFLSAKQQVHEAISA